MRKLLPLIGTQYQECQNPGFELKLLQTLLLPKKNLKIATSINKQLKEKVEGWSRTTSKVLHQNQCTRDPYKEYNIQWHKLDNWKKIVNVHKWCRIDKPELIICNGRNSESEKAPIEILQ